jgi:ATP-binding cassette subfamily B protein
MLRFVWRADKTAVLTEIASVLLSTLQNTYSILIYKLLIDGLTDGRSLAYMLGVVLLYALLQTVNYLFLPVSNKLSSRLRMRLEKDMHGLLLAKAAVTDAEKFDDPEYYDALSKAAANSSECAYSVLENLKQIASSALYSAAGVAVLAALSPIFIALCAVSVAVDLLIRGSLAKQRFAYSEEIAPLARRSEYFKGLLFSRATAYDVKQYRGIGTLLLSKYSDALTKKQKLESEFQTKNMLGSIKSLVSAAALSTLVPYTYLAWRLFAGAVSIADMTALISAFQTALSMITNTTNFLPELKTAGMYAAHFRAILEYEPKIEGKAEGLTLGAVDSVEFRNVTFAYPDGENVLRGVSFTVARGEKLALVGVNGAGKTTIVKLLMRFYDPDAGAVLINGRDLREYNVASLRAAVTTVFQEFPSYSVPIDEFVACAEGEAVDTARVADALRRVGLYEKVMESGGLHAEYSKFFDENGVVFSGGQLQKLAIARMLYKGGDLLIMDEPSSALDPESEYEINRDIAGAARDKTIILISHRLSATRDADKIVLIEDGEVRETGGHAALIAQSGRYAHLFRLQAGGYGEGSAV